MDVVQQLSAVFLVLALLAAAVWALRRGRLSLAAPWSRGSAQGRPIETLDRAALTAQHTVHLVRVNGREMILVTYPQGCSLVAERDAGR